MQIMTSYLNNCPRSKREDRQILKIESRHKTFLTFHFRDRVIRNDIEKDLHNICVPVVVCLAREALERNAKTFRLAFCFGVGNQEGTLEDSFDVVRQRLSGGADRKFLQQVQRHLLAR